MSRRRYLSATEAAAMLGIRPATLYAYVSRGLLRSESEPGRRGSRYPTEDVEALLQRIEGRRDPPGVARAALDFGVPVLDSRLTLIADGRLYYRGHDVQSLVRRGESLETVAALLWLGDLAAPLPPAAPWRLAALASLEPHLAASRAWRPFARLQAWLPLAMAEDPAAFDLRPSAVVATGAWLLQLLAHLAAGIDPSEFPTGDSVAAILARAWAPPSAEDVGGEAANGAISAIGARHAAAGEAAGSDPVAVRLLDAAMVLSADHELNVSAFTARCVASAAAPPHAAVVAALAALGGARHGGHCDRVEALFAEVAAAVGPAADGAVQDSGVRAILADRLRRGEEIPGFGHPLYPDGDPRCRLLLELAVSHRSASPRTRLAATLAAGGRELLGEHPNLDFGLVTLAAALELPPGAALALFALGRTAGWIAHILEQYADPRLIRPRARYVGAEPPRDTA